MILGFQAVQRIGHLAQPGRQHQVDTGCQRGERSVGHLFGHQDLQRGQRRVRIDQPQHRASFGYFRNGDIAQYNTLDVLPSKRHLH
jgi:hypothetical protein